MKLRSVMVVDDDPGFLSATGTILRRHGFRTYLASNANAAADTLAGNPVDAILLDLRMPDVPGDAFLRALRRDECDLPVVLMSGNATLDDAVVGLRFRAADLLRKPFRANELVDTLERVIGRPPEPVVPGTAVPPVQKAPAAARPASNDMRATLDEVETRILNGRIRLPSPGLLHELWAAVSDPDCQIDEVVRIISLDITLCSSIVKAAQSSRFRSTREVRSVREACVRLGTKRVCAVAHEIMVGKLYDIRSKCLAPVASQMWRNTHFTARGAHQIANRLRHPEPHEITIAALVHNIGEVAVLQVLDKLGIEPDADLDPVWRFMQQRHEELGQQIARSWQLPSHAVRLAGQHHDADTLAADDARLRAIAMLSWGEALRRGATYEGAPSAPDRQTLLEPLGLDEEALERIYATADRWA